MERTQAGYVLAIDLGTSGPKVALCSLRGEVVGWEREPTPLLLLPGGGAEQDPDEWWAALTRAVLRLLGRGLISPQAVRAIGCTGQWAGTVAVDRSGRALRTAIIWLDSRGAPYVRRRTSGPLAIDGYGVDKLLAWIRLTGGLPSRSGKDSIAHILWLKHEQPDLYRATYKFLEPKDYLNLRLTGAFAATHDSITLHWVTDNRDLGRIRYDAGLARLGGLELEKLPALRRAVDVLGPLRPEVAAEWGLPVGTPVLGGMPDIHSAALGSGAAEDYAAHLYLGTSAWLACHVPFKKTDLLHNMASLPSAIPGRYLLINEQETAGACLTFLRDNLLYPHDELTLGPPPEGVEQAFDRIAATVPAGSEGVIFMPWLNGERTPVEDAQTRAGFINLSLRTTRAHLIRAALEGVACNARWLLGHVERFIGRRLEALTLIGGGANSDVWCQIHADVLNRPVRQAQDPLLANVRGVGYLAGVALGCLAWEELAGRVPIAHTYLPQPEHRQVYDDVFREFLQSYRATKPIYARLNPIARARSDQAGRP
jgi:xylulokinase